MRKQIHKRLPKDFVEDVIRTFCEEKIGREQACEFLKLSKAQLCRWKEKYLILRKKGEEFKLYDREVEKETYSILSFRGRGVSSRRTFLYNSLRGKI